MNRNRLAFALAALVAVLAAGLLHGCSDSNPTYPAAGGGGGGGGGGTGFDSGSLTAPASYVRTFAAADTIGYHCTFHVSMGMVGTVRIADGGADSAVVTASGTAFSPATATIKPGGYVHWKITGGTHTVTSD